MSTKATQDATPRASRQGSLAEFHDGFGCGDFGEPTDTDEDEDENEDETDIAHRDDTRSDIDYSQDVFTSEHGTHYHAVRYGTICACPNVHGETTSLGEAVKDGNLPCSVCHPIDYRDQPDEQIATVEGSL